MEKQELRIGNAVMYKGKEYAVRCIEKGRMIGLNTLGWFDVGLLEGVPLTKEILERIGFKHKENGFVNNSMPYWAKDCVCLFYNQSDVEINQSCPDIALSYLAGYGFAHAGSYYVATFKWITYVDQLQNLYHSLTHKELPYGPVERIEDW